jgi:hypothetical protein
MNAFGEIPRFFEERKVEIVIPADKGILDHQAYVEEEILDVARTDVDMYLPEIIDLPRTPL